ncbi:MAG: VWA domain-containing protein, partial [Myxococcota bacterium]
MAPLFVPLALVLGASGCMSDDGASAQGEAAQDGGSGFDGGPGGGAADDGNADGGMGDDGDGEGGGPSGDGGDGGADAPVPDDVSPPDEEPPEECIADEDVTLFLSPDDSNSTSSPVQAREAVLDGFSGITSIPIRTWEFLNYYAFDYAPPTADVGLALHTDLVRLAGGEDGEYVLQIGVASPRVAADERDPIALTLVLDTSGSMQGHAMDMLKESCRVIAASLHEGDKVSMVTWSASNSTVLGGYSVTGANDETVLGKCNELEAGGGTDLHGGLVSGYALAEETFQEGITNRIVLISDGGANAGVTDVEIIGEHAGGNDADGIYMVGVGVGDATTYNDDLMDVVTDAGKGASVFINDAAEAQKIFGDGFVRTMGVAARDVQVRLDMPPGFEVVRFSGEEISEDPAEVEPQHLAP